MQFQFNNVYVIGVKPAQLFSGDINWQKLKKTVLILVKTLSVYGLHQLLRKPKIFFIATALKKIVKSLTPKNNLSILPWRSCTPDYSTAGLAPKPILGFYESHSNIGQPTLWDYGFSHSLQVPIPNFEKNFPKTNDCWVMNQSHTTPHP